MQVRVEPRTSALNMTLPAAAARAPATADRYLLHAPELSSSGGSTPGPGGGTVPSKS